LLISNIASSAKIIDWGVSIFGLRLAFDAGTILFPLSYIFGDVFTEVYGYRRGRRVIWMGFFCSGLMSLVLWIVGKMPAESGWAGAVGMERYNLILGGVSSGVIVLASMTAYWAGDFPILYPGKNENRDARTLALDENDREHISGEGIDTTIFISIATILGVAGFSRRFGLT
jgi:uncharacterized integral membrane protein (TIGR00697 family)